MIGTKCVVWVSVKETQDMQINSQKLLRVRGIGEKKLFIPFPKPS